MDEERERKLSDQVVSTADLFKNAQLISELPDHTHQIFTTSNYAWNNVLTRSNINDLVEKETKEVKEKLKELIDIKIEMLPVVSTGIYTLKFEEDTKLSISEMMEVANNLKRKLDMRYDNNENVVLIDINSMSSKEMSYQELNKYILELQKILDAKSWF